MGSDLALSHTALRMAKKPCSVYFHRPLGGGQRRCGSACQCVRRRFTRTRYSRALVVEPRCGDALKKGSARLRAQPSELHQVVREHRRPHVGLEARQAAAAAQADSEAPLQVRDARDFGTDALQSPVRPRRGRHVRRLHAAFLVEHRVRQPSRALALRFSRDALPTRRCQGVVA